jgi:hypothetical protein
MARIDIEGLSEDERQLVAQFISILRRTRKDPGARADLLRHWDAIRNAPKTLASNEADALAAEAIAYVRSRS